jgi:hypothetical protein
MLLARLTFLLWLVAGVVPREVLVFLAVEVLEAVLPIKPQDTYWAEIIR